MKKTVISILAVGVLISAATTSVFAAGSGKNYTDSDNNGICDYTKQQVVSCTALCSSLNNASAAAESVASKLVTNAKYIDADNDGVCDNYTGSGNGGGYVDSDNDGVCDNYTGSGNGSGYGSGNGNCGNGNGGNGSGYVDSDNDGVCDNYANRVRPQDGTGYHHGSGHGKNR